MKVLFNCGVPFHMAHGGAQIQIERTKEALEQVGVTVDWLRWWEDSQPAEIVHCFGRPSSFFVSLARNANLKVVVSDLLTSQGSRNFGQRFPQRMVQKVDNYTGRRIARRLGWDVYGLSDRTIFLTDWELRIAGELYGAPKKNSCVVPNGVENVFFLGASSLGKQLNRTGRIVCTATITERKRVVELAQAAVAASVPIWVVGKPYSESDPYYLKFLDVVRQGRGVVRFEGQINDRYRMAEVYQSARGFVLLSAMESLSLSALEAVAAGSPLLLSDLPWARSSFGDAVSYCPVSIDQSITVDILKKFHEEAPGLPVPPKPKTWREVALQLKKIYEEIMHD